MLFGLALMADGASKWLGWRREWYTRPRPQALGLLGLTGLGHPLRELLLGASLIALFGAALALAANVWLAILLTTVALVLWLPNIALIFYTPSWSFPGWTRTHAEGDVRNITPGP